MISANEEYQEYLNSLKRGLEHAYSFASEARRQGFDPADEIEIKIAKDIASRVEALVGPVGISKIIYDMENEGQSHEEIAFNLAAKISAGKVINGKQEKLIEQAVRTGVGILTEGMLVAPTEGISKIRIKSNPDGSNYVAIYFTGPIRSAGGTVAALAVALTDHARRVAKIGDYRATDSEIERYVEEINIYEARTSHLQYKPADDDVRLIAKNCPVCIDGDPTEDVEVSVYRDIPQIETNRIRGGIPLVMCEGIAQKAAKVYKFSKKFELNWDWLEKLIKVKRKETTIEIKPDFAYLEGLVAGRPVFAYPSVKGGFRLRYGKSRTNGLMAKNIHPATMVLLDDFIAVGTHVKLERPGKGAVLSGCDKLEPPIVKLKNGTVLKVRSVEQAKELQPNVEKILFLGDILITYCDFLKSGHPLVPSGWCEEWWLEECKAKGVTIPKKFESAKEAFEFSKNYSIPLHPDFVYFWHDINTQQVRSLAHWLSKGQLTFAAGEISGITLEFSDEKEILEELGVEHTVEQSLAGKKIFLTKDNTYALFSTLGIELSSDGKISNEKLESACEENENKNGLEIANALAGVEIKANAPVYIGARMGRPEKAKERVMEGNVNVLFPTGSPKNRSILRPYKMSRKASVRENEKRENFERSVYLELARFVCPMCRNTTAYRKCEICNSKTFPQNVCPKCGKYTLQKEHCAPTQPYEKRAVNLFGLIEKLRRQYGVLPEDIRGVKGLSSACKIPERLEKGFFRGKHDVYVFRDGTCRFDATDVPLTHFKPIEISTNISKLHELGYTKDYLGNELTNEEQILPLKPQDIVISEHGADYFIRVAKFIDDILVGLYKMQPFYKVEKRSDLIGHLFVGLSPHTSSGVLVRLIGFSKANVGFGHPYFHAAKRRNCFSSDTRIPILENNQWQLVEIEKIVKKNLKNPQYDDFGTIYSNTYGLKTLSFNQKTGKFALADITHVSMHAPQKTMLVKTKSGRQITVTLDHPFPTEKGKTPAMLLDSVFVPIKTVLPVHDVSKFNLDFMFLLGVYLSENIKEKSVPSFVFALPERKRIAFLQGMFFASGSVFLDSVLEINLSLANRKMLDEISFMLFAFGIKHSLSVKKHCSGKGAHLHKIKIYGDEAIKFIEKIGVIEKNQANKHLNELLRAWKKNKRKLEFETCSNLSNVHDAHIDEVVCKKQLGKKTVYSITVPPNHTIIANGIVSHQCDGDEDAVMLLLDGLLNFSKHYLSEMRGGTMDAPITISTTINPKEVDDEVHGMELVFSYPLEFYHAAEKYASPADIKLKTVKDALGKPEQYDQLGLTHETGRICDAPLQTAYVALKSIPDKIELQFRLQKRLKAVDIKDATERLILSHFIPDLYGNLRSFSRQTFRCVDCNEIYRRTPLAGKCLKCGGKLILTINKGGIQKYLEISKALAIEYSLSDYLKQRLNLIEKEIKDIFEDEKIKQTGILDFM